MNVKEIELELARKLNMRLGDILHELGYSLPPGHQLKARLLNADRRKKRGNAAAGKWSPESGRIEISFEAQEQEHANPVATGVGAAVSPAQPQGPSEESTGLRPAEADLLKALSRAESRPGWSFVPLKKFRDEILPAEHFASMPTAEEQRNVLRSVIDKKFVLVGKVPNPKSPQFPVTTVRLNGLMPEVKAVLGRSDSLDLDFCPVEIRGEPLSTTILRERR